MALLCLFLLAALPAGAQSVPVRGVVTGGDGEALVGCMVIVKGNTSQYSVTDVNGAFELKGVSAGISHISDIRTSLLRQRPEM